MSSNTVIEGGEKQNREDTVLTRHEQETEYYHVQAEGGGDEQAEQQGQVS